MTGSYLYIFLSIFIFVGFVLFVIGTRLGLKRNKLEKYCTQPVFGKVTDLIRVSHEHYSADSNSHSLTWIPVFEYDIAGQHFKVQSSYSSTDPKYTIGQDVKLYYNPDNFTEYIIAGDNGDKTIIVILCCMGMLFFILGLFGIVFSLVGFF